jgi:hypothetical protein
MMTASAFSDGVADAVAHRTVEAAKIAAARSANQRTVFMVGHALTPFGIMRGDREEPLGIGRLPRCGQRR